MKKKIVFLSVLALSLLTATGCKKNNTVVDGKKETIKGNIKKTVTEIDQSNSKYQKKINTISNTGDGIFTFCKGNYKCGAMDATGKEIVPFDNDSIGEYSDELVYYKDDDIRGFYDKSGNKALETTQLTKFSEGYAIINNAGYGNGSYLIDKSGNKVLDIQNAFCYSMTQNGNDTCVFSEGLMAITSNSEYSLNGYIDTAGNQVIDFKYNEAGNFNGGYAIVNNSSNYFVIDKTGREILTAKKIEKTVLTNCFIVENENNKKGIYDVEKGEYIVEPKYFEIAGTSKNLSFFAKEKNTDNLKYYDKNGNTIIDNEFKYAGDFSEGYAYVYKSKEGSTLSSICGYINEDGKLVIDYLFNNCQTFTGGYAAVLTDKSAGIIDNKGKVVIGLLK